MWRGRRKYFSIYSRARRVSSTKKRVAPTAATTAATTTQHFAHQNRVIAERRASFVSRRLDGGCEVLRLLDDAHALATAAHHGLDQHRITARNE